MWFKTKEEKQIIRNKNGNAISELTSSISSFAIMNENSDEKFKDNEWIERELQKRNTNYKKC